MRIRCTSILSNFTKVIAPLFLPASIIIEGGRQDTHCLPDNNSRVAPLYTGLPPRPQRGERQEREREDSAQLLKLPSIILEERKKKPVTNSGCGFGRQRKLTLTIELKKENRRERERERERERDRVMHAKLNMLRLSVSPFSLSFVLPLSDYVPVALKQIRVQKCGGDVKYSLSSLNGSNWLRFSTAAAAAVAAGALRNQSKGEKSLIVYKKIYHRVLYFM